MYVSSGTSCLDIIWTLRWPGKYLKDLLADAGDLVSEAVESEGSTKAEFQIFLVICIWVNDWDIFENLIVRIHVLFFFTAATGFWKIQESQAIDKIKVAD